MSDYVYQHGFSQMHAEEMYDGGGRKQKAMKTVAVLGDYLARAGRNPADMTLLDIGCSTGFLSQIYGTLFGRVIGVDIDAEAVDFARRTHDAANVEYRVGDSMDLDFPDAAVDAVTCTQIYEHVPDSARLLAEIRRVLKPGGICYFAAGNRVKFMEAHYGLPFLSVVPKPLGHLYVRLAGKAERYYETHLSLWGLRRLVRDFEVTDYSLRVVRDPERFHATEMVRPGSLKQTVSLALLEAAYWLCPTYIWILRKPDAG